MTQHTIKRWIQEAITKFSNAQPPKPKVLFDQEVLTNSASPYSNAAVAAGAAVYFTLARDAATSDDFALINALQNKPTGIDIEPNVVQDGIDVILTNRTHAPIAITNLRVQCLFFKLR